jgi:hypothetical protein
MDDDLGGTVSPPPTGILSAAFSDPLDDVECLGESGSLGGRGGGYKGKDGGCCCCAAMERSWAMVSQMVTIWICTTVKA